jgi:hypothetical protein
MNGTQRVRKLTVCVTFDNTNFQLFFQAINDEVRRHSEAATALLIALAQDLARIQRGVALRLPPHSKITRHENQLCERDG